MADLLDSGTRRTWETGNGTLRKVCRKITTGYMSEKKFNEAWKKYKEGAER